MPRSAIRQIAKHPGFSVVIVLTLGLVIGVCSTSPLDPLTYGVVFSLIALAALLASLVPAYRGVGGNLMEALRYEWNRDQEGCRRLADP